MHSHGGRLGDTALTTVAITAPTAGQVQIYGQWISRPMVAGIVFDTSVTYKAYFQVLESATNDNLFARCGIRILSRDGLTVRATVKAVADYSTITEFSTTLRNKAFLDGDAGAAPSYTTVAGDRIVFEFGAADSGGTSIQGSCRFGSTGAGIADLPENETDTTTTSRPWFETSLNITFETPTTETRYVLSDGVNTSGGDGTTNTNSGANRAFASVTDLVASSWWNTDWATQNKRAIVNFSGTVADAHSGSADSGVRQTAPDCYVSLNYDSASAMVYSPSYYREEVSTAGNHNFANTGILYLRVSGLQFKSNPPNSGGHIALNVLSGVSTPEPGDVRYDRICGTSVLNNTATGGPSGIGTVDVSPNVKCTVTNSVLFSFKGTGSTHSGYKKQNSTTVDLAFENCLAYDCNIGFNSETNNALAINCNAQACANGWSGTWAAGTKNNASDIASDAPGTSPQTGTTSFVSAGSDFHLTSGDTVCKDNGVDLSADARLPFSTDGDGQTRTGTWDIGPDEYIATGPSPRSFGTIIW